MNVATAGRPWRVHWAQNVPNVWLTVFNFLRTRTDLHRHWCHDKWCYWFWNLNRGKCWRHEHRNWLPHNPSTDAATALFKSNAASSPCPVHLCVKPLGHLSCATAYRASMRSFHLRTYKLLLIASASLFCSLGIHSYVTAGNNLDQRSTIERIFAILSEQPNSPFSCFTTS